MYCHFHVTSKHFFQLKKTPEILSNMRGKGNKEEERNINLSLTYFI